MGLKKEINWDLVELYVKSGCSQIKICKSLFIDEETLRARVKEKYDMEWSAFSAGLRSEGEILLEAQLFQKAMNKKNPGDTQMLIWLSKCKLAYKEPEMSTTLSANQEQLDQSHRIMELEHQLTEERNKNGM